MKLKKPKKISTGFKLNKKSSFVLYLGDEGLIVLHHQKGELVKKAFYAEINSDETKTEITQWLQQDPAATSYLLLDTMDQNYQIQSFPPVAKFSVQKLVDKKLERDFVEGDLTGSLPLGREKTGRKDWKFLLISAVPTPEINAMHDLLLEQDNPFGGMFLTPVEAVTLSKTLSKQHQQATEWRILVFHSKVSGFRQVITRDDRLVFTRITRIGAHEKSPLVIAGNVEQEVISTVEYLKRIAFNDEDGLNVDIIASDEISEALDETKIPSHQECRFMTPLQAAESLKMKPEPFVDNHFADLFFASFFHHHKKTLPIFTELSKKLTMMRMAFKALGAATVLICLLLTLGAGYAAYEWVMAYQESTPLERRIRINKQDLAAVQEEDKLLPKDLQKIEDLVAIHEKFSQQEYAPQRFIDTLIETLEPGIKVLSLDWKSQTEYQELATKQPPKLNITLSTEFDREVDSPDLKLNLMLEFLESLRVQFPEYAITHSNIPGTIVEGERIIVDFTDSKSRELQTSPTFLKIEFAYQGEATQ